MRFDFSKINDRNSLVPAGQYAAELRRTKPLVASTGTPGILFVFELSDPEYVGKTLFLNLYHTQSSMWRVQQVLSGFGVYTQEELSSDEFDFQPNDLIGTQVILEVSQKVNPTNNKLVNNVDQVFPAEVDMRGYEDDAQIALPFSDTEEALADPTAASLAQQMNELLQTPEIDDINFNALLSAPQIEVSEAALAFKAPKKSKKNA